MAEHHESIHSITEGETVTLFTDTGFEKTLTCVDRDTYHVQDPDIVQTQKTWEFINSEGQTYYLVIMDGLRRFEWEAEYPRHSALWCEDIESPCGFVTEVQR